MLTATCGVHGSDARGRDLLYYDATGVGAGVKGPFGEMADRTYRVREFLFGGAVGGEETAFVYNVTNKQMFARKNAQAGWNLHLRAENTRRLLHGQAVNPAHCLFISTASRPARP